MYWDKVRQIWADYISTQAVISLKSKVEGKLLHEYLISLSKDYAAKKVSDADIDGRIKKEITKFIGHDEDIAIRTNLKRILLKNRSISLMRGLYLINTKVPLSEIILPLISLPLAIQTNTLLG